MRILLIGGSGFIGSHLVDVFLEKGHRVVVFDRIREKFRRPIPNVTFVHGEMGNRGALQDVLAKGVDGVIHLASHSLPQSSNDDPIFDVQTNLVETLAMLDLFVQYKVKKVIFASSGGTVYGIPKQLPITEEHPTDPICAYGIVKLAIEKYLHLYHRLFGLNWVALRLSNPYGIRQDPISVQGVIAVFAARMLQQKPVVIWGIGDTTRDFINVRDVADLFYKAMNSEANGVFNVGSGVGVSINALLAIMSSQLGVVPVIVREPPRKVDVPAIVLDCERARKTFSWAPRVSLEEGIIEVGDWLRGDVIDSANNSGALAWQTKGEETCKSEVRLQESIHFIR